VEVVADEDGNNEAEGDEPEPVAQGNSGSHILHNHGRTDWLLEVVAGEVYGIGEDYAVGHWSMPTAGGVEGYAVGHRRVPNTGEAVGEAVDYNAVAVAVSEEAAVGM